jgi:hypothetical protein
VISSSHTAAVLPIVVVAEIGIEVVVCRFELTNMAYATAVQPSTDNVCCLLR